MLVLQWETETQHPAYDGNSTAPSLNNNKLKATVCNQRGVKGKEIFKTITNSRQEIHESPLTCTGGWLPGLGMFYQSQTLLEKSHRSLSPVANWYKHLI